VKIFTFTFNRPDILEIQYKTFKKYCKNDFEFIVIHDSRNEEYVDEFSSICEKNNFKFYHHKSRAGKQPSEYHSDVLMWTYKNIVCKKYIDDIIFFLDHDIFMVDYLDILKYIDKFDMVTFFQRRPDPGEHIKYPKISNSISIDDSILYYAWPGFCIFKNSKLKDKPFDFMCKLPSELSELPENLRQNLDSGGGTYKLFKDKSLLIKNVGFEHIKMYNGFEVINNLVNNGHDYLFLCDRKFLHYKNASNWHTFYSVVDTDKTNILFKIFEDIN